MLTNSIIGDIKHYMRYGNMVMKLIFINVGVFLIFGLLYLIGYLTQVNTYHDVIVTHLEVTASLHTLLHQPWSVFTYMFLHTEVGHIFFNMLWLYWFGEIFILYLNDKKVLPVYIMGGLGGAFIYILAYNIFPVFKPVLDNSYMLGASASIFAIVFAAAGLNPDHEMSLIFIGRVKIKYVAVFSLLLDIINIPHGNAGGYIAHVGGALVGMAYVYALRSGYDISAPFTGFLNLFKRKSPVKVGYKNTGADVASPSRSKTDQARVDEILDKISRSGYDSLSKEERDILFNFSKK